MIKHEARGGPQSGQPQNATTDPLRDWNLRARAADRGQLAIVSRVPPGFREDASGLFLFETTLLAFHHGYGAIDNAAPAHA